MGKLVVTLRLNDTVRIGSDVEAKVVKLQGSQIRLSFEAPQEVPIVRGNAKRKQPKGTRLSTQPKGGAARDS